MSTNDISISYSPDGGKNWIGPLKQEEFNQLKDAGIIAQEYLIRTEPTISNNTPIATSPTPPPAQAAAAPVPSPAEKRIYYVLIGQEKSGPHTESTLREMLEEGKITPHNNVWAEGMPAWAPLQSVIPVSSSSTMSHASNVLNNITGLGALDGFSLQHFFSEIFRHHSQDEIVDVFCAGSRATTPDLKDVPATWPTPWVFARLLLLCGLLFIGFLWGSGHYSHPSMYVGMFLMGVFSVPLCTMVLMYELNARRDVPFYFVIKSFLVGGLASMIFTFILSDQVNLESPYWAGLIEEPAKLLAAIFIASNLRKGSVHIGLLLGCAVGAGFAAFETAAYILGAGKAAQFVMLLRGILTPCGHTVWTAITAGAYWYVMNLKVKEGLRRADVTSVDFSILLDVRFLRIAFIPVVLHMIWNSSLFSNYIEIKWLTLGVIGWLVLLRLVQVGINQIKEQKKALFNV